MQPPPRPNPLTDELSEEAKMRLARAFAELQAYFAKPEHTGWRARERLRNATAAQSFSLEYED